METLSKSELINLTFDSSGVANLQMTDKAGKNGFRTDFVDLLIDKLNEIRSNEEIKVLVISGLPDVFCSGADLETLEKLCKKTNETS